MIDPVPGRTISLLYRHYSVRRPCFNELAARISRLIKSLPVWGEVSWHKEKPAQGAGFCLSQI